MDRSQVRRAAASLVVLGTGANSAPRIMAALCNPEVGSRQVAALVGKEPALYARVLRVAISPYYGQSRSITTIDRALVVLGVDAERGIAPAACLARTLPRRAKDAVADMKSLIHHTISPSPSSVS